MYNREREQEILNILKASNTFVSTKQLCDTLFASESSVRRDLKSLEKRGLVKRSYGGASLENNFSSIMTFNNRTKQNADAKREIAKKASMLIKEGQIIFLDQSSTAFYLANELVNRSSITVVTNNIEIMMLLSNSRIKIISSGGFLSEENRNCLIGGDAAKTFENVFADIAFFSVKGVLKDGTITDCSREEIIVRNAMLKNARQKVFLCDSTKFGVRAPFNQCSLNDVNCLISENNSALYFLDLRNKIELL